MLERFTERARRVVVLAEGEARSFTHNQVGTEHVLLGLLLEWGLAARMLASLAITVDRVRTEVARTTTPDEAVAFGIAPFTPCAVRVLERASREALSLGYAEVRAEHILLGLTRENKCGAARILRGFGAGFAQIRGEVLGMLDGPLRRPPPAMNHRIEYDVGGNTPEGLWERYKVTGDERARERLVVGYSPLVKAIAGRLSSGLPAHVSESDLISYGLTGLISAIERFDLTRATTFETYAIPRIHASIIDEVRTLDWVPRSVRRWAAEIERVNQKLVARLQRSPTGEEMAAELGISDEEFSDAVLQISNTTIGVLDGLWNLSESAGDALDAPSLLGASAGGGGLDAQVLIGGGGLRDRIADAIAVLPVVEGVVIALLYSERLTLRDVAAVLGVTEPRVVQLRTQAVLRLRSTLRLADD